MTLRRNQITCRGNSELNEIITQNQVWYAGSGSTVLTNCLFVCLFVPSLALSSPVLASGSHKRSHSLGEKEIGRSPPSPAPEQPFRDRSNTLNEKPTLPVIRDKYKDLTGEVEVSKSLSVLQLFCFGFVFLWANCSSWLLQESERYAYEWQRCLESALEVCVRLSHHSAFC